MSHRKPDRLPRGAEERHPFVTHFIEPHCRQYGPKAAALKLREWVNEWRQFFAEEHYDGPMFVQEFEGDGEIKIRAEEGFELARLFIELYEEQAHIEENLARVESTQSARKHAINWLGTYQQFRTLLELLASEGLIDEETAANYGAVFENHFLKKGNPADAQTVRSAARKGNWVKTDELKTHIKKPLTTVGLSLYPRRVSVSSE